MYHNHIGIGELLVILLIALIKFGIPLAFAIWVIIAIKRIGDGIKRISSRLDEVERKLSESKA